MADDRARRVARAAALNPDDVAGRARWIAERLRTEGERFRWRADLAAYCRDPAAVEVRGAWVDWTESHHWNLPGLFVARDPQHGIRGALMLVVLSVSHESREWAKAQIDAARERARIYGDCDGQGECHMRGGIGRPKGRWKTRYCEDCGRPASRSALVKRGYA